MENLTPTTVEEFNKNAGQSEMVELKSGKVFEIYKKINSRKLAIAIQGLPLTNDTSLTVKNGMTEREKELLKEKQILRWEGFTDKEKESTMKFNDSLLVIAVKNPPLSLEKTDGKIYIEDIDTPDYYELLGRVSSIAFGGKIIDPLSGAAKRQD